MSTAIAQVTNITINLDPENRQRPFVLNKGDYKVEITGDYDGAKFKLESYLVESTVPITVISTPSLTTSIAKANFTTYSKEYSFNITDRKLIEIEVQKINLRTKKVVETYKFTFNGVQKYKWHTTVGLSAITLINRDTYKTVAEDDAFKIVQNGSQTIIDPVVLMQFTYINLERPTSIGVSGGIGFDFENLSVFGGPSIYFGHNLILTAGVALNQQLRLDSKYDKNQIVPEALESSDLNSPYYRINPFISLTFALDKNLFKK